MKAIRIIDGKPELVQVPKAEAGPDQVVVKIVSSSICGSDLHLIEAGIAEGRVLGHEFAGTTPDGTAVAIEPVASCGTCGSCEDGHRSFCSDGPQLLGIFQDGGMAEEVVVPTSALVPLAPGVNVADACLVEPLAVALHSINRGKVQPNHRVLVIGAGPIGLCAAAVLKSQGVACDIAARHDHQKAAAEMLGASTETSDGYDVVIDAVGTTGSITQSIRALRPQGTVSLVGSLWQPAELTMEVCMKEATVVPAFMYGGNPPNREFDHAAEVLAGSPNLAQAVLTHRMPLDAAAEGFATAANRSEGTIKVVFDL